MGAPHPTSPGLRTACVFLIALAVHVAGLWLQAGTPLVQSKWPYFVYYAHALLSGQLHFAEAPPALLDLARFEGRLYMHHPPFPALLLAPGVALFGLGLPDRLVSALLGAINGAAFYALLLRLDRRALVASSEPARLLLTAFFLFGTVHLYLSMTGNPWEFAHVVCNALVLLALHLAVERRYALTGLVYVAILFTRSHVFLSLPLLLGLYWLREAESRPEPRERLRGLLPTLAICAAGVGLLLLFNAARFGDPFENGVSHHAMHEAFRARYERHGYFDLAYLPRNLRALLFLTPRPTQGFPFLAFTPEGLGIFFTSPLYLYLLRSLRRPTRPLAAALWAGVLPPLVPILLLMGTGEIQFGHRYSADLQVLLALLCLLGMAGRASRLAWSLAAASLAINALGAAWFLSRYA